MLWKGVSKYVSWSYFFHYKNSFAWFGLNQNKQSYLIFHCSSSLLFFNANFKKLFLRQRTCFSEHTSNRIFPFIFYVFAPCYIPRGDISYIYTTLEMSFEVTSLMQTDSVYNYFLSYLFWIKSLYIFWQISH